MQKWVLSSLAVLLFALDQAGMWILVALGFRGNLFLVLAVLLGTAVISYEYWFMQKQIQANGKIQKTLVAFSFWLIARTHIWTTYLILAGLGAVPYGWLPGMVVHRAHPVPAGFAVLLVFNGVKTYLTACACLAVIHSAAG